MLVKIEKGDDLTMQTLLVRRLVSLLMGIMLLIGLFVSLPGVASAHSTVAQSASNAAEKISRACDPKMETSTKGARICLAPTKYENICGGKQWYGPVKSHDGHNIGYTYSYGSQHCFTATWDISRYELAGCTALMYIPAGYATGYASYTSERRGSETGTVLNQSLYGKNDVGEFVQIFPMGQFSKSIKLTDQTDYKKQGMPLPNQGKHDAQIGWGTDAAYSLDLECP
jgi:hypothetical protein